MSEPYDPPSAPPPGGPPAYVQPGLPWDRERTGGALIGTVKRLTVAPLQGYAEMREKGDYVAPILFAVILGTLGTIVNQIWSLVWGSTDLEDMPAEIVDFLSGLGDPLVVLVAVNLVLAPVVALLSVFIGSAIMHLMVLLVGGTRDSTAGFEGTLRVVGYSSTSNLAMLLPHPYLGLVAGAIWGLVLTVLGLRQVHHMSTGRAIAAVLLLPAICCFCVFLIGFVVALASGTGLAELFSRFQP